MSMSDLQHQQVRTARTNDERSRQQATVIGPEQETWQEMPGERFTVRVPAKTVNNALCVFEGIIAPDAGPPLHYHDSADEIFYILSGSIRFLCGGERLDAQAGTAVVIPRGAHHCFRNVTDTPARLLAMLTPGNIEPLFPLLAEAPPQQWEELCERYGTMFVDVNIRA